MAATLSSAGGELLQLMPRAGGASGWTNGGCAAPLLGFDAIIVDEAAQVGARAAVLPLLGFDAIIVDEAAQVGHVPLACRRWRWHAAVFCRCWHWRAPPLMLACGCFWPLLGVDATIADEAVQLPSTGLLPT